MDIENVYKEIFYDNIILTIPEVKKRVANLIHTNKLNNTTEGLFNLLLHYIKKNIKEKIQEELFRNYNLPIEKISYIIQEESKKNKIILLNDDINDILADYK